MDFPPVYTCIHIYTSTFVYFSFSLSLLLALSSHQRRRYASEGLSVRGAYFVYPDLDLARVLNICVIVLYHISVYRASYYDCFSSRPCDRLYNVLIIINSLCFYLHIGYDSREKRTLNNIPVIVNNQYMLFVKSCRWKQTDDFVIVDNYPAALNVFNIVLKTRPFLSHISI